MLVRKRRASSETCALAGCFLIVFITVMQFLVFTNRNRTSEQPRSFPGRGLMGEELDKRRNLPKEATLSKPKSVSASSIQARVRARAKANQEVRELEKALAKLMRENTKTPEESIAEISNTLFAYRVKDIIHAEDKLGAHLLAVNVSRLGPELPSNSYSNHSFRTNLKDLDANVQYDSSRQMLPYSGQLTWKSEEVAASQVELPRERQTQDESRQVDKDGDRSEESQLLAGFHGNTSADYPSRVQSPAQHQVDTGDGRRRKQIGNIQRLCQDIPDTLGKFCMSKCQSRL